MAVPILDSPKSGDHEKRLTLHGMPSMNGLTTSVSPFVGKVEVFLRFIGLDYDADVDFKGPKGKIPWITHGDVVLGDSTFIIEYIKNTFRDHVAIKMPDTSQEKAINTSCIHICEDNLLYAMRYYRFLKPKGFNEVKKLIRNVLSFPTSWLAPYIFRRKVKKELYTQGLSRHSENDISHIVKADMSALSTFLGNQKYFFGDRPCETDSVVFSFLEGLLYDGIESPPSRWMQEFPNLVEFVDNIRDVYFPPENPSKFKAMERRR